MITDMQDRLEMFSSEEDLENASLYEPLNYVGVVFLDKMSYQLRFPHDQVPQPSDYIESIGKMDKKIKAERKIMILVLSLNCSNHKMFLIISV